VTVSHIFGYRRQDVRQNLYFKDDENIIYFNSSCVITHNLATNDQDIFGGSHYNDLNSTNKSHNDDIVSFDYFSDEHVFHKQPTKLIEENKDIFSKTIDKVEKKVRKWVASGQRGLMPLILVWNADTKEVLHKYYLPKGAK